MTEQAGSESPRRTRVEELVQFLCSAPCAGRAPGTPGSDLARERLEAELAAAGVVPAGSDGYRQRYAEGVNLLARVPGRGALRERAVLVAAHYDHLGQTADGADAYWGADDNAAAVAILIELARALVDGQVDDDQERRSVILALFDCEEPPHFTTRSMGSMVYVDDPPPGHVIESIDQMICMDLVGHALGGPDLPDAVRQSLFVLGAELSEGTPALVDQVGAQASGVVLRRMNLDVIPALSDYYAFVRARVPALFLTCGRWEHYHSPTDTPEKLDYPKILATVDALGALVASQQVRSEAPVVFVPDGHDDPAAIETLRSVGELLAPLRPQIAEARAMLDDLARAAAAGPLNASQRHMLSMLVIGLETTLQ